MDSEAELEHARHALDLAHQEIDRARRELDRAHVELDAANRRLRDAIRTGLRAFNQLRLCRLGVRPGPELVVDDSEPAPHGFQSSRVAK